MRADRDRVLNAQADSRTNARVPPLVMPSEGPSGLDKLKSQWASMPMIPRILMDRSEGIDNSWAGFDVRTLLIGEESAGRFTFHDVIIAPGASLPEHHLANADTYLYVQEGEAELTVGSRIERAGRDGFAYIPENTTQAIRNVSGAPVRLFLWYSPAGPERAFARAHNVWLKERSADERGWRDALSALGFVFHRKGQRLPNDSRTNAPTTRLEAEIHTFSDFADLRAAWAKCAPVPKIVQDRQTVGDIPLSGQDTKVLLSGDEGSGRCVVFNYGVEPAYRAPAHHQPSEEEIFMVIEGTLQLTVGTATRDIPRGGFGFIPRYGTHGFVNTTNEIARTVTINSPAGHERGFEMLVRAAESKELPDLIVAHGWSVHEVYEPSGS